MSSVEGDSWCAVTTIFPGYGDCQCNDIAVVEAGVISVEQLKTSMILLSHGALINSHVIAQLTHFAPVTLSTEIRAEDLLNQCCICLSPDVSNVKNHASRQNAMDITHLDIDQLSSVRARAQVQVAELPNKIKRFELKQNQNTLYNFFSDWTGTMFTLIGLRMKAEDIGTIKRSEHKSSFCKSLFKKWKHKSMIQKSQQAITVTIQQRFTNHFLKTMLCAWKSACQYATVYREKRIAIVKSMLIKWIRNRRLKKSDVTVREQTELQDPSIISSDPNESIVPQSVQDCQFDLSSSDICPANTSAKTSSNKIQSRTLKTQFPYLKDSFFAWKFVVCKTQIKRHREIALCFKC
jgi:hypothetical protein